MKENIKHVRNIKFKYSEKIDLNDMTFKKSL